jgi:hypothetical protein
MWDGDGNKEEECRHDRAGRDDNETVLCDLLFRSLPGSGRNLWQRAWWERTNRNVVKRFTCAEIVD